MNVISYSGLVGKAWEGGLRRGPCAGREASVGDVEFATSEEEEEEEDGGVEEMDGISELWKRMEERGCSCRAV